MAVGVFPERREAGTTNQAPKHRVSVLGSADHTSPSGERPQCLSLLREDDLLETNPIFFFFS